MSLLEVQDLNVWFDLPHGGQVHAVQGVSFGLDEGQRFGLVGGSGCGRTATTTSASSSRHTCGERPTTSVRSYGKRDGSSLQKACLSSFPSPMEPPQ